MSDLPPAVRERILAAAAREPSMTRQALQRRRTVVLVSLLLLLAATVFMRGVPTFEGRPLRFVLIVAGGAGIVTMVASLWVLGRGSSTLGRPRSSLRQLAIATPLCMLAIALLGNVLVRETLHAPAPRLLGHLPCVVMSLLLGGIVLCAFTYLERGSDPVAPRSTGASLGAVAGAWSWLVMAVRCSLADPIHITGTHILPIVVLAYLGAAAGGRWIAVRAARPPPSSSTTAS